MLSFATTLIWVPSPTLQCQNGQVSESLGVLQLVFGASLIMRRHLDSYIPHYLLPTNLDLYKDMVLSFREVRRTLHKGTFSVQYEKMLDPDLRLGILSSLIEFIGKQI